jgi:hypothetical protein
MDDRARAQLQILLTLQTVLAANRVRWWLRGGWAIDFMLGRITHAHADIDMVVWVRHRARVYRTLQDADLLVDRELPVQTDFRLGDVEVSVIYLTRRSGGVIITQGIPEWEWPAGSLGRRPRLLDGIGARVVDPRQLLWEKEGYERGTGRPPRPKDLVSMETLRAMIAEGQTAG